MVLVSISCIAVVPLSYAAALFLGDPYPGFAFTAASEPSIGASIVVFATDG
jgi:hypothetical protein